MNIPPLLIYIRFKRIGIWFPFLLIWLPLFALLILFTPFAIIGDFFLVISGSKYHHFTVLLLSPLYIIASMRGLEVHVQSTDFDINIKII
jgi:hypothetical protein